MLIVEIQWKKNLPYFTCTNCLLILIYFLVEFSGRKNPINISDLDFLRKTSVKIRFKSGVYTCLKVIPEMGHLYKISRFLLSWLLFIVKLKTQVSDFCC